MCRFLNWIERIGPYEGLVEEILLIRVRYCLPFHHNLLFPVPTPPADETVPPFLRDLGEDIEPRPHILTSLGIVGGCGDEGVWPELESLNILTVEGLKQGSKLIRASTHFVQGDETVINIKGRVLNPLGHNGPGYLLEPHHKIYPIPPVRFAKICRIIEQ